MGTRTGNFLFVLFNGMLLTLASSNHSLAESTFENGLHFDAGYRSGEFEWSIAGGGIDVLSELTWDDLNIYQIRGGGELSIEPEETSKPHPLFKGEISYGWIVDGENRDSDYAGSNRTLEWSRSVSDADDGNVLDISAGAGLRFLFNKEKTALTPMVGWSYHEQELTMTHGYLVISDQAIADALFGPGVILLSPVGPITGLDSTYDARWHGPWIGLDLSLNPEIPFSFFLGAEYHWGWYEGKGVWNLRATGAFPLAQDPSFEHEADSRGVLLRIGTRYTLSNQWNLRLSAEFEEWETEAGTDRTFFASGTTEETRLNEVEWRSTAVMLGFEYLF